MSTESEPSDACVRGPTWHLAGHAAAALRHQFVRRDGLLRRMILGR